MRDQHVITEGSAIAAHLDRKCHAAEIGKTLLVLAAERQWHQPRARRQDRVAELSCERVTEAARAHARDRQAAGCTTSAGALKTPCVVCRWNPPAPCCARSTLHD